jgi:Mor family transcriptional regulator
MTTRKIPKKSSRKMRDLNIYREYHGLNEAQTRTPVAVLVRRYRLTRGRIYQIIKEQTKKQEVNNPRIEARLFNSEKDAARVAELLRKYLEV